MLQQALSKVHPHACGENGWNWDAVQGALGSPPRVWGKQRPGPKLIGMMRFTPTRVGKTTVAWFLLWVYPVHPHACGENIKVFVNRHPAYGSPPRVWGKPGAETTVAPAIRFTPTRVGKTDPGDRMQPALSVHPHACGENPKYTGYPLGQNGSPPRVWGKRLSKVQAGPNGRFTPTRVGKTARTT